MRGGYIVEAIYLETSQVSKLNWSFWKTLLVYPESRKAR